VLVRGVVQSQLAEIVSELESASTRLDALRRVLPAEAWARRPAPGSWSAGECIAHLNLTAAAMVPLIREALAEARRRGGGAPRRLRRDPIGWMLWRATSSPGRFKSKTAASFVPAGDQPIELLAAEFARWQDEQIALVREADGLPIHRVKIVSPFDSRFRYNAFAALSILPRHEHRHLWQAEQAARTAGSS
jgi:hypothetical protein